MSFEREVPQLTQSQINAAKQEFVDDVRRELVINGDWTPTTEQIVTERMWERIRVTPVINTKSNEITNTQTIYVGGGDGGLYKAPAAARDVAVEARSIELKSSFGADPSPLLVARLVELGIPQHEAQQYANRVQRSEDGRVGWRGVNGLQFASPAHKLDELSDSARAEFLSPKRALAEATKLILAERQREKAINSPGAVAHRDRIAKAF